VGAVEGSITILTTNHRDRLDPALIRPGRCDREFELGYLTPASCARMFDRFFHNPELAAQVATKLGDFQVAPAVWQSYLQRQEKAEQALVNCDFALLQDGKG
jgi:mitochondrial chaperone BCS1